jgi:hypothetical protein
MKANLANGIRHINFGLDLKGDREEGEEKNRSRIVVGK